MRWFALVGLAPAAGLAPVRTRLKGEVLDSLHSRVEMGRSGRIRTCGIRRMKPAFCLAEIRSAKVSSRQDSHLVRALIQGSLGISQPCYFTPREG